MPIAPSADQHTKPQGTQRHSESGSGGLGSMQAALMTAGSFVRCC